MVIGLILQFIQKAYSWRVGRYHHSTCQYSNVFFALALICASLLVPAGELSAGACFAGVPGTYTCSGGAGADVTQNLSGSPLSVVTSSGFGINTAAGDAFTLSGANGVSFTDQYASQIIGQDQGIYATNSGTGVMSITTTGTVVGIMKNGIYADNLSGSNTTDLIIEAVNVSGHQAGISARNSGSGVLSLTALGTVTGGYGGNGIYARNYNGTDLDIQVANVKSIDLSGIYAENNGTGRLLLTSSGRVEGGVVALSYGTDLSMDLVEVSGGIVGSNHGSGALSLTTHGTVSNDQGVAILVMNHGTDLILDVANVSGHDFGIYTFNFSSGIQSISATGWVTGQMAGIYANNASSAGEMSITVTGTVVGADSRDGVGIAASNYGVSGTRMMIAGTVEGGLAGIVAETHGSLTSIINAGTVRNLSNFSNDLAIQIFSGPSLIENRGLVMGSLLLGDQGNRFTNTATGIWNTAGATNDFGATGADNIVHNLGTIIAANGSPGDVAQTTRFNNIGLFQNSGVLTMANGRAGDTSIVAGTYESDGGSLVIDTVLGDSTSRTDTLVTDRVSQGGRGPTRIYVNDGGGFGALTTGNGIPMVQVIGGAEESAVGAFVLGAQVKAGVYEYSLFQHGVGGPDGNWYLRSTIINPETVPNYRAEVPVYMTSMSLASRFGLAMLGSCDDRSGAYGESRIIDCGGAPSDQLMWGRVFGVAGDVGFGGAGRAERIRAFESHGPSYEYDLSGFQVGVNVYRSVDENGSHSTAGLYVGAGQASGTVDRTGGGRAGTVDMDGYSLGAYWTYKHEGGWYIDVVGQGTRYGDIDGGSVDGQRLKSNGWGGDRLAGSWLSHCLEWWLGSDALGAVGVRAFVS